MKYETRTTPVFVFSCPTDVSDRCHLQHAISPMTPIGLLTVTIPTVLWYKTLCSPTGIERLSFTLLDLGLGWTIFSKFLTRFIQSSHTGVTVPAERLRKDCQDVALNSQGPACLLKWIHRSSRSHTEPTLRNHIGLWSPSSFTLTLGRSRHWSWIKCCVVSDTCSYQVSRTTTNTQHPLHFHQPVVTGGATACCHEMRKRVAFIFHKKSIYWIPSV